MGFIMRGMGILNQLDVISLSCGAPCRRVDTEFGGVSANDHGINIMFR